MEEGVAIDVEGYPTAGCDEHRYRATRPLVSRRQFPRPGSGAAQSPDDAGEPAAFGCVAVTRAPLRHSPPGGDRDVSRREAAVADQPVTEIMGIRRGPDAKGCICGMGVLIVIASLLSPNNVTRTVTIPPGVEVG
jgi:hypothetical protein